MTNVILIVAAIIIISAVIVFVMINRSRVNLKDGEVLLKKSGNNWSVSDKSSYIPMFNKGLVTRLLPFNGNLVFDTMCLGGEYLRSVKVNYLVRFNPYLISRETLTMDRSALSEVIESSITNNIKSQFITKGIKDINENINEIIPELIKILNESSLTPINLVIETLGIDITTNNLSIIRSFYEEKSPSIQLDEIDEAEKKANREIEIAKINQKKQTELNNISIQSAKIDSDKDIELNKIQMAKYYQINAKKSENNFNEQKRDKENQLKLTEIESESNIRMTEIKSTEQKRKLDLERESKLKQIEYDKEYELTKLNSELEITKSRTESEIESANLEKSVKLTNIQNESEVEKAKFKREAELSYEREHSKERELDIDVIIPAKKEAEKEKILAKTKSEVKSIDTESTIESSKKKLEFKKVEEAAKAEIKKQYDLNDLEVYEKMMNVAKDNPELAIQWKNIDKEIKIAQIQGESLTKMNLGQITISGSESSNVLGDFINKIIPAIVGSKGTQTIPLPTKSKSSKSKGTEVEEVK